jgi:hypothetical protein
MHSVTLEEIHRDPAIVDRALGQHEPIEILDHGKVAGTLVPAVAWPARMSERGFPISKGIIPFGSADVARIEGEADRA